MSAWNELQNELQENEVVEAIVFGKWGWGGSKDHLIPDHILGKTLTVDEAEPYMHSWGFYGGYGSPNCFATYIWTNKRVFWVTQYDGSTHLDSMPRNPIDCKPYMPGG